MKKLLVVLLIFGTQTSNFAQDAFQFTANLTLIGPFPPNPEDFGGLGLFSLEGNQLSYRLDVAVFAPWTSQILGPGPDGPVLFNLSGRQCFTPIGTNLGSCRFVGSVVVPDPWLADLMANRWYVAATFHASDGSGEVNLHGRIEL